jgi:hypothetical protein
MRQDCLSKAAIEDLEIERTRAETDESWHPNLNCFISAETVIKITVWLRKTFWRKVEAGGSPASIPTWSKRVARLASEICVWQPQLFENAIGRIGSAKGVGVRRRNNVIGPHAPLIVCKETGKGYDVSAFHKPSTASVPPPPSIIPQSSASASWI